MLNQIDLSRIDLNLLVLFEAVLEERHVGRTAERLNLSASAVSHGLGRLRRLLNDPLFLRTPRGVVATDRALELAAPIAGILAGVRAVLSTAAPFDPATSTRRFVIGAPDGVSAILLPPLLATVRETAPHIDIGLRQLLPIPGETSPERAWRSALDELEARRMDVAIVPSGEAPLRFHAQPLYEEDFVIAMRSGHPLADGLTVDNYCAARHLVVSLAGDPHGFVDQALAAHGLARRVALTVPNFMYALAVIAESDMIAALPRHFARLFGPRFSVMSLDPPLPLGMFSLNAIVPKVAMADAGLAWVLDVLARAGPQPR